MATSGSKSVTVTSYDTLTFSWSESSQSIANNTTTIAWTLQLIAGSSGRIQSSVDKSWSVTVNGTKYSGKNSIAIGNNETKTLASGTTTIAHNSDGTKSFSYSFSQQFDITFSGSSIGTKSGSGSGTLDTIARKSSLTVANGTLGTAQTLTISEYESTFKHKLKYTCGDTSGYILGSSSGYSTSNSVSWTPPLSLASENTTGTSVSIKFTLYTYTSGGDSVGSNSYTKTFTIPNKPSCTLSISDATGKASTHGGYIKGISKLKITVTPDVSDSYSPIASYKTTVNDATYTTASFTTDVLKKSGSMAIKAIVTDKRGKSGEAGTSVLVIDYTAPTISKLSVNRCDSNGNATDQGDHIKVVYSGAITSINKNTAKYQLKYKKTTESTYATVDLSTAFTVTDGTKIFAADTASSYDVQIVATDALSPPTTRSTTASSGFTIMHFNADGNGMGLGKMSEFAGLDVGFATRFRNNVQFDKPAETRTSLKTWGFDDTVTDTATGSKYAGITRPDGTATGWTRVTQTGLLPYASGGQSSSLGTATWAFKNGYFQNLYVKTGLTIDNGKAITSENSAGETVNMMYMGTDTYNILNVGGGVNPPSRLYLGINGATLRFYASGSSTAPYYFIPAEAGKYACGTSSYYWYGVYTKNFTQDLSDGRKKENIIPFGQSAASTYSLRSSIDIHSEIFDQLKPVQYNHIDDDGRICFGLIAQDVIESLSELGFKENELDLVRHEYYTDEETNEEKDTYSIAYTNLIAMLIHEVQKLKKRVNKLENI